MANTTTTLSQVHPGVYLRHARETAGVTRREVADAAGYTKPYILMIENGKTDPPPETVGRIAIAIGEVSAS